MLVLKGTPRALDAFLRPVLRGVQLGMGGLATLVLGCLGWWWWLPLPLALSFLAYEWYFWARGDRPVELRLHDDRLSVYDPLQNRRLEVPLAEVHAATLLHRDAKDTPGATEAVIVLAAADHVLLALPFRVPPDSVPFHPHDVDADLADTVLGGLAGLVRALAPIERVFRQPIHDARGITWLRQHLPPAVWQRTAIRVWRGQEPSLDLFGYHNTPCDGLLTLSPEGLRLTGGDPAAPDGSPDPVPLHPPLSLSRSHRSATLFTMHGEDHTELTEDLPLLILDLRGAGRLAVPAPAVDPGLSEAPLSEDLLHTHGPEGAAILWHLATCSPADTLPHPMTAVLRGIPPEAPR